MASTKTRAVAACAAGIMMAGVAAPEAGAAPAAGTTPARAGAGAAAAAPTATRPRNPALSPGRAGDLVMGRTTVHQAKDLGYIRWIRDDCGAYWSFNWSSSPRQGAGRHLTRGTLTMWWPWGSARTTKGLRVGESLARGKALYPTMRKTATVRGEYGTVYDVYSVKGRHGWLDWFLVRGESRGSRLQVRALSVRKPIPMDMAGC